MTTRRVGRLLPNPRRVTGCIYSRGFNSSGGETTEFSRPTYRQSPYPPRSRPTHRAVALPTENQSPYPPSTKSPYPPRLSRPTLRVAETKSPYPPSSCCCCCCCCCCCWQADVSNHMRMTCRDYFRCNWAVCNYSLARRFVRSTLNNLKRSRTPPHTQTNTTKHTIQQV